MAALVLAAEALARSGAPLAGDLVVCTVTDEEATGAGAIAAVGQLGVRADGGVIPAPSGFDVWVACRGDLIPRSSSAAGRATPDGAPALA